jgi:hypothetical protein
VGYVEKKEDKDGIGVLILVANSETSIKGGGGSRIYGLEGYFDPDKQSTPNCPHSHFLDYPRRRYYLR